MISIDFPYKYTTPFSIIDFPTLSPDIVNDIIGINTHAKLYVYQIFIDVLVYWSTLTK